MKYLILFLFTLSCLRAEVSFNYRKDPYGTHQPVVYEMALRTKGAIIEFGCGHGSTDLLHEICKKEGRLLVSLDDDMAWLSRFSQKYLGDGYESDNSGWHKFFFVPDRGVLDHNGSPAHWIKFLQNFELLDQVQFDLCFIDQSPWLARYETLKLMKSRVKYLIVHDCDYFPTEGVFGRTVIPIGRRAGTPGVFDFSDVFKFFRVYFPNSPWPCETGPPTLLGSDFDSDLPEIDFSKY